MKIFLSLLLIVVSTCSKNEWTDPTLYEEMKESVILSYAAYCEPSQIANWTCDFCKMTQLYTYSDPFASGELPKHTSFYSTVQNLDTLVVSFRGSVNLITEFSVAAIVNWIYDFKFDLVRLPWTESSSGIKVHSGFLGLYEGLNDTLSEHILDVLENNFKIKKIKFVGHSLGSATCVLAALDLIENSGSDRIKEIYKNDNFQIMNFGCPRIGNHKFYHYYKGLYNEDKNFRVVNQKDPITGVPGQFFGYHHIPYEYYFQNDTENFVKCDGTGEDPNCGDSHYRFEVTDHSNYIGVSSSSGCV